MNAYLIFKWLHLVSVTILIGTGSGIAFFQWFTYRQGNVAAIAVVTRLAVRADCLFTTSAAIVILVSGFMLMEFLSVAWNSTWALLTLVLYTLAGACWLPIIVIELRLARLAAQANKDGKGLPEEFRGAMRFWFWLGLVAFLCALVIFWLMLRGPAAPLG
jgi:uncharacterized membrane protein